MKKGLVAAILVLCCASVAVCAVEGESNFGSFSYPAFDAPAPVPPEVKTLETARQYRRDVEEYIKQAEAYAKAARNDISRIDEAVAGASGKISEATDAYNQWASTNN